MLRCFEYICFCYAPGLPHKAAALRQRCLYYELLCREDLPIENTGARTGGTFLDRTGITALSVIVEHVVIMLRCRGYILERLYARLSPLSR